MLPLLLTVSLSVLTAEPASNAPWEAAAESDGVSVYTRERKGQNVKEVKAVGLIDAPPQKVFEIVRDYKNYDKMMPYTEDGEVLATEDNGKKIKFYAVVNVPLVSRRDYVIETRDVSQWNDGKGYLMVEWNAVEGGKPPRNGIVRLKLNDGYWKLEPRDNGTKTLGTYWLLTDPGGSIPGFIVNKGNKTAVPDVFRAVRKEAAKRK